MNFLFPIGQAVITIDSEQLFICLNAAQCKIAHFSGGGLAIAQEWTKFVKDKTEI